MIVLLQQGGLFWMLPVLLIQENGTAGLLAIVPGLAVGILILLVCTFWRNRCEETSFPQSLQMLLGKPAGMVTTFLFLLLYLLFAVFCLSGFVEVVHTGILKETPRILLLLPVFLLAGWLAWNGLEDIARFTVLAAVLAVLLLFLTVTGSIGSFQMENLLPLQIHSPEKLIQSIGYSSFSYSIFLVMFMVYPSLPQKKGIAWQMPLAAALSAALFLLWVLLALGVFGQFSMEQLIWLPLELARMIQVSAFLERTEALFIAIWFPVVLANSGLLLWAASEAAHQLLHRQKSRWLHWGMVAIAAVFSIAIGNLLQLFYLEQALAAIIAGFVPLLLLAILAATLLYSRKKAGRKGGQPS